MVTISNMLAFDLESDNRILSVRELEKILKLANAQIIQLAVTAITAKIQQGGLLDEALEELLEVADTWELEAVGNSQA